MKKILILFISILFFSSSSSFVFAQISSTINLEPRNPEPKSIVVLTLESYAFDVNTAIITWKANGKTVLQGQGEKSLSLKTGSVGESSKIGVTAELADGSFVEQSISVTPSSITLLFESPNSYVPLLYEGRSLPGEGALVRVSALPSISDNGVPVPPSSLSYTWYINDTVLKAASGAGKQSASIRLDYFKTKTEVKVIARSPLGNSGEKTLTLYPHKVMPLIYTYDSILGSNFANLIGKRFEATEDFTFSLEPFYVSDEQQKPASFVWYLDGLPSTPLGGRLLSLHPKENSYGSKILTIDVFGSDKRLQKGSSRTELIFDTRK